MSAKKSHKSAKIIAKIVFTPLGILLGWWVCGGILDAVPGASELNVYQIFGIKLGSAVFLGAVLFCLSGLFLKLLIFISTKLEKGLSKYSSKEILMGLIGLLIGVVLALLLGFAITISIPQTYIKTIVCVGLAILFGFVGLRIGAKMLYDVLPATNISKHNSFVQNAENDIKVLDSSSLIDGRILDIVRTGFVVGTIIIPSIVLAELSKIADSDDVLKKNRGRRGLDIAAALQKEKSIKVRLTETDTAATDIDSAIIKEAADCKGRIVTGDYNLGKLAMAKSVEVLNINDLANAIKPIALPGEKMTVKIVKEGKENGQGVAYSVDGTMIVIENGGGYVGKELEVTVTTALQTSGGRIIFTRIL